MQTETTVPSRLLAEALALKAAGFQIVAVADNKTPAHPVDFRDRPASQVTEAALDALEAGRARGLRVELGQRGARPLDDGTFRVPLALEFSAAAARNEDWSRRWDDVIVNFGVGDLRDSLERGVVQSTPSGARRFLFEIITDDLEQSLPALTTAKWGRKADPLLMAELLTDHIIVAPSGGDTHPSGLPYESIRGSLATDLPELTIADVDTLSAVFVEVSDAGAQDMTQTLQGYTTMARQVRAAYRHVSTSADTLKLLRKHKWAVVKGELPGEVSLARPGSDSGDTHAKIGGIRRQHGQVWVGTSSDEKLPAGTHDAFTVYALLEHAGKVEKAAYALRSQVNMPHLILAAKHRPFVDIGSNADSLEAVQGLVDAVSRARSTVDLTAPMVLRHLDSNGNPTRLMIPRRGLPPLHIEKADQLTLFLRVCQPVSGFREEKEDGKPTGNHRPVTAHSIPDGLSRTAMQEALSSGAVAAVKILATEPVLLPDGTTISEPGYHPEHQILISLPQRDVARWKEGYHVPARPTKAQAQEALNFLATELLADFPFVDESDLARALLMLLAWSAPLLTSKRPAWMVTAPDRGTGKSLLCEICRIVATGSAIAMEIQPFKNADEENNKILTAGVRAGIRFVSADNVTTGASFNSELVTTATTKGDGEIPIRILGTNDYVYPAGLTWVFAGNSISPGGDNQRRVLPVNLEVKHGIASERRNFKKRNLIQWTHDERPKLLTAVHTVLAHGLQNTTTAAFTLGSYEAWCDVFVAALSHLELTFNKESDDPHNPGMHQIVVNAGKAAGEGLEQFRDANDAEGEEWGEFLAWLAHHTQDKALAPGEIADRLFPRESGRPDLDLPLTVLEIRNLPRTTYARRMATVLGGRRNATFTYESRTYKLRAIQPPNNSKKSWTWRVETRARAGATPSATDDARESPEWAVEPEEAF